MGECLERTLSLQAPFAAQWVDPGKLLRGELEASNPIFDLILLDADVARCELSEILARVRRHAPNCKVLLLVSHAARGDLLALTQLGAQGCIQENGPLDEPFAAMRTILDGESYFSPELANALFVQLNGCDRDAGWAPYLDSAHLTSRERDVLRLIAWENLSNKQIARRLHVSLYTVKNHVHNIIDKLNVSDRHGAAQMAQRRNLISAG
jgi:DNA-binding NarL/FixJ family response regulator